MASFVQIAGAMDPIRPSRSLRDLIGRHRWIEPAPPASLRLVVERHRAAGAGWRSLLCYNTYLLPGVNPLFDINEILAVIGVTAAQAVADFGFDVADVILKLHLDPVGLLDRIVGGGGLAERLGVDKDALEIGGTIVSIFTWGAAGVASALVIEAILTAAGRSAVDVLIEVLGTGVVGIAKLLDAAGLNSVTALTGLNISVAGLLLHYLGFDINAALGAKDALEERADAIGRACAASDYDIVALSEVWDWSVLGPGRSINEARDRIVRGWDGTGRTLHLPNISELVRRPNALLDGGLYRITTDECEILEILPRPFEAVGERLLDTDAWASKGVLLTRVRVGPGVIDLYGTHLLSGNDLLGAVIEKVAPQIALKTSAEAVHARRMAQVREMVDFINETHKRENVAILCGDLNIPASDDRFYAELQQAFAEIAMDDLFATQLSYEPRPHQGALWGGTHGGRRDKNEDWFGQVCTVVTDPASPDFGYCDDAGKPDENDRSERIDYLFVERPTPQHTFSLDITRIRRRPFPDASLSEGDPYLSDHIGLEVRLLATPLG